jgi:hypothetical protein
MDRKCIVCGGKLGATNKVGVCKKSPECLSEWRKCWWNLLGEEKREEYRQNRRDKMRSDAGHIITVLRNTKHVAKSLNIPFNLTRDTLPAVPLACPCCEVNLKRDPNGPWRNQPSLDKIIPEKGYVPDNVQWLCRKCNQLKNNATLEELRRLVIFLENL